MSNELDLDTLQAFVDGELPTDEVRQVEAALAQDPAARRTVARLRELSATLRAAYNEPLHTSLPEAVTALLDSQPGSGATSTGAARRASAGPAPWPWIALAASIAAVAVAAPTSYFLAEYRVDQRLAQQAAERRADQDLVASTRTKALESHISGQTVSWVNPDNGNRGEVTPVRTFKTSQGQWCREYRMESEIDAERSERRAIACRQDDGTWSDRLEILGEI